MFLNTQLSVMLILKGTLKSGIILLFQFKLTKMYVYMCVCAYVYTCICLAELCEDTCQMLTVVNLLSDRFTDGIYFHLYIMWPFPIFSSEHNFLDIVYDD